MSECSNDSDSSYEKPVRRKVKRKGAVRKKAAAVVNTANGQFKCNYCGVLFIKRCLVYKHIRKCTKRVDENLKCQWCNLEFAHRGNLVTHAKNMHGDYSYKAVTALNDTKDFKCHVCERKFPLKITLFYHIRRVHFNLQAKIPYAELKKVNQVWFEKVLNSDIVVEIKKTGQNTLIIRKLDENTNIKVTDTNTKIVDLSSLYPVAKAIEPRVDCDICKRSYVKKDYKKHVQEIHMKSIKHHCNNCNRNFKRSYQYLQHVCNKARKLKGVTHAQNNKSDIRIASVESLSISLG